MVEVTIQKIVVLLFIIVLSVCLFFPLADADTVNVTSQLQVQTFQTDFAYINWYFKVNAANLQSGMMLVYFPKNLTFEGLPQENNSLASGPISEEYDSISNLTTFSIQGAIPIGNNSADFPNDRYEGNYFIGCNFLKADQNFYVGGDIPGPTNNYQIEWSLTDASNFASQLNNQTTFMLALSGINLGNYTTWFRLNLLIFHRPPFSEYVGTLVNQVPFGLELFAGFIGAVILIPVSYELAQKQPRKIRKAHFIELILIPISASIIVFVPIYELALHVFEEPLLVMKVEQNMIFLLKIYLLLLGLGIAIRILSLFRERKPRYPWERNR
ncbi:MAG: hypothetical protein ABSA79_10550 [Candidatus Bathyarchaeia archaeon]